MSDANAVAPMWSAPPELVKDIYRAARRQERERCAKVAEQVQMEMDERKAYSSHVGTMVATRIRALRDE